MNKTPRYADITEEIDNRITERTRRPTLISTILQNKRKPLRTRMFEAISESLIPSDLDKMTVDDLYATQFKVKDESGKIVPFVMRIAQWHYHLEQTARDIILKARQHGFSTKIQADAMERLLRRQGASVAIIANEADNSAHLIDIHDRFYNNLTPDIRPMRRGRPPNPIKYLEKDGAIYLGTAGNRQWGVSKTLHMVHASEVSRWGDARTTMSNLMESVPPASVNEDTYVVMESTPNGAGGYFYEECMRSMKGISEFKLHFYPWWWSDKYREALSPRESIKLTTEEEQLITYAASGGFNLTLEQIKWRRIKIQEKKELFKQEYPEDPYTCFLLSGRPRFNPVALQERLNTQCQEPVFQDYPVYILGNEYYQVRIYKRVLKGHNYVIGADVAEGISITSSGDPDFSAAVVRDRFTNEQVATIHGRISPFEFAYLLQEIGIYYNMALLGVERNNQGQAVLGYLVYGTGDGTINRYPNLFVFDDEKPGWPTTPRTRPIMIEELALEYDIPTAYVIRDKEIIQEALSFVINEKGKAEGAPGAFDDLVLADSIACMMRVWPQTETEVQYGYEGVGNTIHIGAF